MTPKAIGQQRRTWRAGWYRAKNLKLLTSIENYMKTDTLDTATRVELAKLGEKVRFCLHRSLYRRFSTGEMAFISGHTCKHRLCMVCNSNRKNRIRQIYVKYFQANPELFEQYDFMHLTLTVPHTVEGWAGKRVYNQELIRAFNLMRKEAWWKKQVWAGQYAVEFTRNNDGLHIHIHSLILVHKQPQSRNRLTVDILMYWNQKTEWSGAKRKQWSQKDIEGIRETLRFLPSELNPTQKDPWPGCPSFEMVMRSLTPQGSTLIGLNSLYTMAGPKKIYCQPTPESMILGVLETLKYLFDPISIFDEEGEFPMELIGFLVTVLRGQRMNGRFGEWYNSKALAAADNDDDSDIEDALEWGEVIHPETGAEADPLSYSYCVIDAVHVKVKRLGRKEFGRPQMVKDPYLVLDGPLPTVIEKFSLLVAKEAKKKGLAVKSAAEQVLNEAFLAEKEQQVNNFQTL